MKTDSYERQDLRDLCKSILANDAVWYGEEADAHSNEELENLLTRMKFLIWVIEQENK